MTLQQTPRPVTMSDFYPQSHRFPRCSPHYSASDLESMRAPIRDPFLEQLREQGFTFVEKHPLKGCIDGGYVRDGVYVSWVYERGIRIDVRIPSLQETTASSNESGFGLASSGGAKFLAARQLLYLNASNGGQILEQVVTLASTGERLLREAGAAKRKPRK